MSVWATMTSGSSVQHNNPKPNLNPKCKLYTFTSEHTITENYGKLWKTKPKTLARGLVHEPKLIQLKLKAK